MSLANLDARHPSVDLDATGIVHGIYDCDSLEVMGLVALLLLSSAFLAQLKVSF